MMDEGLFFKYFFISCLHPLTADLCWEIANEEGKILVSDLPIVNTIPSITSPSLLWARPSLLSLLHEPTLKMTWRLNRRNLYYLL